MSKIVIGKSIMNMKNMKKQFSSIYKKRPRLAWGITAFMVLSAGCYWLNPLGVLLKTLLVVETELKPADVIVLGGTGGQLREAAELYHEGMVEAILVTAAIPERYEGVDAPVCTYHFIMEDLAELGVPEDDIYHLDKKITNMLEGQQRMREWVYANDIDSYMIQPLKQHTRLAQVVHPDTFPNGDVELVMHPSEGRFELRKEIVGIHNTFIYWAYWSWVYADQIKKEVAASQNE